MDWGITLGGPVAGVVGFSREETWIRNSATGLADESHQILEAQYFFRKCEHILLHWQSIQNCLKLRKCKKNVQMLVPWTEVDAKISPDPESNRGPFDA
jgi:hypothetical protein